LILKVANEHSLAQAGLLVLNEEKKVLS
jgi:hypothetical protein